MNMYFISTIRNENERFKGISFKYGPFNEIKKTIQIAEKFASQGYLYIEISDNQNNVIFEYEN